MPSSIDMVCMNQMKNDFITENKSENEIDVKQEQPEDSSKSNSEDENNYEYSMTLPLEVITTVEPTNISYPVMKNMSNGVLTHRNIFTEQERETLRKIVEKYRSIVDTRSRTREIYLEKQAVWQSIVVEYNCTDNIMIRTEKELRKCWDNMKYRAKLAEKELIKTESQESDQLPNDAVQEVIKKMLSSSQPITTQSEEKKCGIANHAELTDVEDSMQKESSLSWKTSSDVQVKKEPEEASPISENAGDSSPDLEKNTDEEEQPVVKKARQESPKLSSILLGESKRNTFVNGTVKTTNPKSWMTKKKNGHKKPPSPVTILPKGFTSCVSIMNIPNPNHAQSSQPLVNGSSVPNCNLILANGSMSDSETLANNADMPIHLGGGVTISPQTYSSAPMPGTDTMPVPSHIKPMPSLKKMTSCKAPPKKSKLLNGTTVEAEGETEDLCLQERLLLKKAEQEEKEHKLKMQVLEKQLQAFSYESQFWALKIQILKAGKEALFEPLNHNHLPNGNL